MNIDSDMKTRLQGTIIVPSTMVPGAAGTIYTISSDSGAGNEGSMNLVESEGAL